MTIYDAIYFACGYLTCLIVQGATWIYFSIQKR